MTAVAFTHHRSAGDIMCMTAGVRDLALTYPDEYEIYVHTSCASLWQNNPYVTQIGKIPAGVPTYRLSYGSSIQKLGREHRHFVSSFQVEIAKQLKIDVPTQLPKPDLHLSEEEKANRFFAGKYWVVVSGGKRDYTAKHWSSAYMQQVVDRLTELGLPCVQAGSRHDKHPALNNVENVIGKTNLRDLLRLIYHAEGVICPVTCLMHAAAALDKPCVVVAGGREHWWWEAYVNSSQPAFGPLASGQIRVPHRYLHTQGLLHCCQDRGCWKSKVTSSENDKSFCRQPTDDGYSQTLPLCMQLISPQIVVDAVLSYYQDGTLVANEKIAAATTKTKPIFKIESAPLADNNPCQTNLAALV